MTPAAGLALALAALGAPAPVLGPEAGPPLERAMRAAEGRLGPGVRADGVVIAPDHAVFRLVADDPAAAGWPGGALEIRLHRPAGPRDAWQPPWLAVELPPGAPPGLRERFEALLRDHVVADPWRVPEASPAAPPGVAPSDARPPPSTGFGRSALGLALAALVLLAGLAAALRRPP